MYAVALLGPFYSQMLELSMHVGKTTKTGMYSSVRPKPPFWFRPDTETETQYLAVTFGRYRNCTTLNWKVLYFYMCCQLPKHLFSILHISIISISYKFTEFEVKEIKKKKVNINTIPFGLNPHLSLNFTVQKNKKSRKKQWRSLGEAKKVTAPKPIPKLNLGFSCQYR